MQSHVLQTRPLYEQHTSTNLAEVLKEVVSEWKLERPAVDPRFKALSHVDNACREHIYNSLTTEIVAIEEQREATETAGAMSSAGRADPEESVESSSSSSSSSHPPPPPPPIRKSAMAELFGELFNTEERNKPTLQLVKGEVTSYMAADSTSLDSDPLAWWKNNEAKYPHVAMLAKRYLAVSATSVPSERVFSTAGDIVSASRSALSASNVDKLIFLKKNLKIQ
ncbi:zinc finger BED domain-containing protein 1-like [Gymnodraco acuticeps]|uniref:Zinc finger BED domain-containing protein 1-like n=1 Tax=Gymnodraco acuticeps TaxID=8218 RepID=A0A6P8SP15_GYMAC|nr:zinc finger BED domain-containing protein 1-like [Gymnodraco acuticeps]